MVGGGSLWCRCAWAMLSFACVGPSAPITSPEIVDAKLVAIADTKLVAVSPDVLVDPATSPDERARLIRAVSDARSVLVAKLGPLRSEVPLAIFCKTADCSTSFVGATRRSRAFVKGSHIPGSAFTATRETIVVLRVDEAGAGFITHELAHIPSCTPALATVSCQHGSMTAWRWTCSGAPDCSTMHLEGIDDLRRVDSSRAWEVYTTERNALVPAYCQAQREVAAWIGSAGAPKLLALLDQLRRGTRFYDTYGAALREHARPRKAAVMSLSTDLGDAHKPFSLVAWIKTSKPAGVIAQLSDSPIGAGYCTAVMGFDSSGRLVAQVLHGSTPELASYTIATSSALLRIDDWSHVAMTWSPDSATTLYVDGHQVATAAARGYLAPGIGVSTYVTWGSGNLAGDGCCCGAVSAGDLDGWMTGMKIFDHELTAAEIAEAAAHRP